MKDTPNDYLLIITRFERKRIWSHSIARQVKNHIDTVIFYNLGESINPIYLEIY